MPRRRSRCSKTSGKSGGSRVGRLEDGTVVRLGFVPEAQPGVYLIVHLGVPVEVLRVEDAVTRSAYTPEGVP